MISKKDIQDHMKDCWNPNQEAVSLILMILREMEDSRKDEERGWVLAQVLADMVGSSGNSEFCRKLSEVLTQGIHRTCQQQIFGVLSLMIKSWAKYDREGETYHADARNQYTVDKCKEIDEKIDLLERAPLI